MPDADPAILKKKVLIVDDDPAIRDVLKTVLEKYTEHYEFKEVRDAWTAMKYLKKPEGVGFDAILLDFMMPYGKPTLQELDSTSDPVEQETGLRLLRWFRMIQGETMVWVSVITAKATPRIAAEARLLLGQRGRIYYKPFDDLLVEHDLAIALGVESKVPPELQPETDCLK